jgi:hypothetical protein
MAILLTQINTRSPEFVANSAAMLAQVNDLRALLARIHAPGDQRLRRRPGQAPQRHQRHRGQERQRRRGDRHHRDRKRHRQPGRGVAESDLVPALGDLDAEEQTVDDDDLFFDLDVGLVVLKPLARALADGDSIRAVIRESGGDRSAVTGGTRVLSDRIVIRITIERGQGFLDRMIALVEGAWPLRPTFLPRSRPCPFPFSRQRWAPQWPSPSW